MQNEIKIKRKVWDPKVWDPKVWDPLSFGTLLALEIIQDTRRKNIEDTLIAFQIVKGKCYL